MHTGRLAQPSSIRREASKANKRLGKLQCVKKRGGKKAQKKVAELPLSAHREVDREKWAERHFAFVRSTQNQMQKAVDLVLGRRGGKHCANNETNSQIGSET